MKRREKQQIFLLEDQFRSDFVILDEMKKCRGFIWRYGKWWVVRVDNKPAQYRTSRKGAVDLAAQIVDDLEAAEIRGQVCKVNKLK